jgi:hypothetical protein
MAGLSWSDLYDVQDGQVVDFEIISALINNENFLYDRAVSINTKNVSTDTRIDENTPGYKMQLYASVFAFNFTGTQKDYSIKFRSKTKPLIFTTIADEPGAVATVSGITTTSAKITVTKAVKPANSKKNVGRVFWLAIATR